MTKNPNNAAQRTKEYNKSKFHKRAQQNNYDIVTGEYVSVRHQKASSYRRFVALNIDLTVLVTLAIIFITIENHIWTNHYHYILRACFEYGSLTTILIFNLMQEYLFRGQTIGKRIVKIRTISADDTQSESPTFAQCFIRFLIFPIDTIVGIFLMERKGGRLGDLMANCRVIMTQKSELEDVSLDIDMAYAQPGYKVRHTEARTLTDNEANAIRKVLYQPIYESYLADIARLVRARLNIDSSTNDKTLLKEVICDYNYYKNSDQTTSSK